MIGFGHLAITKIYFNGVTRAVAAGDFGYYPPGGPDSISLSVTFAVPGTHLNDAEPTSLHLFNRG